MHIALIKIKTLKLMIKNIKNKIATVTFIVVFIPFFVGAAVIPQVTSLGSFGNEMVGPTRIAVNEQGTICVTDPLNRKVNIYASNGQLIDRITNVSSPMGIDCDDQRMYVGDSGAGNVRVYSLSGEYQRSFGGSEIP
jgi:hypothetical protein